MMAVHASWLTRVEQGRLRISHADVQALLAIYGRSLEDRPILASLLDQISTYDYSWWAAIGTALDERDLTYLAHEAEAVKIRTYELALIPGPLQTEDYARAILATRQVPEEVMKLRLEARMRRQQILTRSVLPTTLHAVISEAALQFLVGGPAVWSAQMRHLARMAGLRGVTVQILPFAAGAVPAAQDSFTLLDFGPDEPTIAALEQQQSTTWLTQDTAQVADLVAVHDTLSGYAMTRTESIDWLWEVWAL